jgi:hypothetical protein
MVLFWKDDWNDAILQDKFSCLYSYAKEEDISVADIYNSSNVSQIFHLPLSPEAFNQYQEIQVIIRNLNITQQDNDIWTFKWGDKYSSRKYYKFVHRLIDPPTPFIWIWKSKLWPKLKVFVWLLLSDRLNTRNMLKRRHLNIGNNFSCALCNMGEEETLEHLFFRYPFSISCWSSLNITWSADPGRFDMLSQAKSNFQESLFFEIFTIGAWGIWKERNNLIFKGIAISRDSWKARVTSDLQLLRFKVNQNLENTISLFIDRLS